MQGLNQAPRADNARAASTSQLQDRALVETALPGSTKLRACGPAAGIAPRAGTRTCRRRIAALPALRGGIRERKVEQDASTAAPDDIKDRVGNRRAFSARHAPEGRKPRRRARALPIRVSVRTAAPASSEHNQPTRSRPASTAAWGTIRTRRDRRNACRARSATRVGRPRRVARDLRTRVLVHVAPPASIDRGRRSRPLRASTVTSGDTSLHRQAITYPTASCVSPGESRIRWEARAPPPALLAQRGDSALRLTSIVLTANLGQSPTCLQLLEPPCVPSAQRDDTARARS